MTQAAQVLVVDDSEVIRQAVRLMLEPHGYQVREATDGDEGLEAIRAESDPMIVLLDYQMQRMDGGEVLKTVASEGGPLLSHEYIMITSVANTSRPTSLSCCGACRSACWRSHSTTKRSCRRSKGRLSDSMRHQTSRFLGA